MTYFLIVVGILSGLAVGYVMDSLRRYFAALDGEWTEGE